MTPVELKVQKQLVQVFESLKKELKLITSEVHRLGWRQRNALISHVYSDYTMHEELNDARMKWGKKVVAQNVHQWLFDQMVKQRDIFGYFQDYPELKNRIEIVRAAAIRKEEFEIAEILIKWQNRLP
jgi:hypothetical protein